MAKKWYIVNVVAGQENKICDEINKIATENDFVERAFIPVKKIFKHVRGKKVEVVQKLFPNYVFVNMEMSNANYGVIRNIPKVLGFLGSKLKPEEVSDEKISKLMERIDEENNLSEEDIYEIGETVKVIEGPFESFTGTVESKDSEKNILKISISIFGRPTVIDIEAKRVEKI
ncbi:MAG: transcription termination/antitermination protein NusG [Rickettsiales bacterium]|nr:transcription termination/antitermination protein NusG [Rickettsiales bacterium]